MNERPKDERYMRMALREARRGLGHTSPNPAVGAILVARGKILARGFHAQPGGPHAELQCLMNLPGAVPARSTLYVTLEPCSTLGKTGPCTDAIIEAGVSTVVIGATDPNPKHNGRGVALLQTAGIKVRIGVLEAECTKLNEAFNKWIVSRRPFVIAKCGMSLDGRLSLASRDGRWITSAASRRDARQLRGQVDAILVGAGTVRLDNPRLSVRGEKGAKQPWRVILTNSGKLPASSHLFCDRFKEKTLIYRSKSLKAVLRDLGKKQVLSLVLEGGGMLLGQALDAGVIDKVQIYLGPVFTGGPVVAFGGRGAASTRKALRLDRLSFNKIGSDVRVEGYVMARGHETSE